MVTSQHSPAQLFIIFDSAVKELLAIYDVTTAPVPVETILQHPRAGMWDHINFSEMPIAAGNIKTRFNPRMSLARMLARMIVSSDWGTPRELNSFGRDEELIQAFARALIMPRDWLTAMPTTLQTPLQVSLRYEVPEEDARLRLAELRI